jgi:hypothetical protein
VHAICSGLSDPWGRTGVVDFGGIPLSGPPVTMYAQKVLKRKPFPGPGNDICLGLGRPRGPGRPFSKVGGFAHALLKGSPGPAAGQTPNTNHVRVRGGLIFKELVFESGGLVSEVRPNSPIWRNPRRSRGFRQTGGSGHPAETRPQISRQQKLVR